MTAMDPWANLIAQLQGAAEVNNDNVDLEAAAAAAAAEELNEAMLAAVPPVQQKQVLGERLFPKVEKIQPGLAGKITGMLLEMNTAELLQIDRDQVQLLLKVQEGTEVLLEHSQTIQAGTGTTVIPPGTEVQAEVRDLDARMPPASRPLLTERQLAGLRAGELRQVAKLRMFYIVHKLQPLMSKRITDALVIVAENNPAARGWRQEGNCWVNAAAKATARKVLWMLDNPVDLAKLVNIAVETQRLRSIQLPAGLRLRSDEEVLAAAAGLLPEGQALPWAPQPSVHCRFPRAFRCAVQALLLCRARARRLVSAAEEAGAGGDDESLTQVPQGVLLLDSLPEGLIPLILALAAHPLEAWS